MNLHNRHTCYIKSAGNKLRPWSDPRYACNHKVSIKSLKRKLNVAQICGFRIYVLCNILHYCMNLCSVLAFSETASKTSILARSFANTTFLYLFLSTCPFILSAVNVSAHYILCNHCARNKHKDKQEKNQC